MICNGFEKTCMGDLWSPYFVIDRSAKIFMHSQRTDKSVLFCFCTSLLDEMKKKLYNID